MPLRHCPTAAYPYPICPHTHTHLVGTCGPVISVQLEFLIAKVLDGFKVEQHVGGSALSRVVQGIHALADHASARDAHHQGGGAGAGQLSTAEVVEAGVAEAGKLNSSQGGRTQDT